MTPYYDPTEPVWDTWTRVLMLRAALEGLPFVGGDAGLEELSGRIFSRLYAGTN